MTATTFSPLRVTTVRESCALCATPTPVASPLGLCGPHLQAAANELARLTPRQALPADSSPATIPFSELCRRCGSYRHETEACDA